MMKAKFWLVQIVMLAIVSLAFSSPVFAAPPDHAGGAKGVEMKNDKAADQAKTNADDHAGFEAPTGGEPPAGDDEPVCTAWFGGVCIAWE